MELEWNFNLPKQSFREGYKAASSITINGESYTVPDNLPADTSLNEFIRNHAHLKGTKFMCLEGGCGACIVTVQSRNPDTGQVSQSAVNACLAPVFGYRGTEVTTIEGVGSKSKGYAEVQTRLAKGNGSQCGFCSVGQVMNMYSLLKSKPKITMKEIEDSFGGSLCRCTGYRSILHSFKSFASDAPKSVVDEFMDIEDIFSACNIKKRACSRNGSTPTEDTEVVDLLPVSVSLQDGATWYHPTQLKEVFEILGMCGDKDYMLVGGNTAQGVYRIKKTIKHYISLSDVPQLHSIVEGNDKILLGANVTLSAAMDYFNQKSTQEPKYFGYLKDLADHINLIANVPVRNVGTLAGNLSIKNEHNEFPSDLFLILVTFGATIIVEDGLSRETTLTLVEYRTYDMTKKIITKIILPKINKTKYVYRTFKIMSRAQNTHAYVNAGFLFKVDKNDKFSVLEKPTIVFGNINSDFVRASDTEEALVSKQLLTSSSLALALDTLQNELKPDHIKPEASAMYRKGLACALFYKFVLGLSPESVDSKLRSGGSLLQRPLSSGHQLIATDKSMWPVSQPIPKIEALLQCSGESEFINDLPSQPNEVYGAFVLSTVGPADDFTLDAVDALALPGVVAIQTAKDVPGANLVMVGLLDPIYAEKSVPCAGYPLAAVFANTRALAYKAASMVKINYTGVKKPVFDVAKIVESGDTSRIYLAAQKTATSVKRDVRHKLSGTFWMPSQYHMTMETQSCYCVPSEDGLDVYPSSQAPSDTQAGIAQALNISVNKVNLSVRRCGGGYGSKLVKCTVVASACAVAAYNLQRPVRWVMTIEENMSSIGKRSSCLFKYEAGVNETGVIQYLNIDYYQDDGWNSSGSVASSTITNINSVYETETWSINGYGVRTDLPTQTYCRAPGTTESIGAVETIMEHIAVKLGRDPTDVKMHNLRLGDFPFPALVNDLKQSSEYEKRAQSIKLFNDSNRWKKRGISLVPMDFPFDYYGIFHSMVSVFAEDGTVAITHGCVEMGQGLNTKVAQVCAYVLGVNVKDVSVKPTMCLTSPNSTGTGGSTGSESAVYATKIACEKILKRLEPIKKEYPAATWKELVQKASNAQINLNATHMFKPSVDGKKYNIYGVTVAEVEIDVLTGQHIITRADILEDCGISLSPDVDIGQIEGAFVMGLGLYTLEELIYSDNTGELLTNRTWNYRVPGAKDIPVDFRVEMRQNSPNPVGVLKSKATGEPPLCMSIAVVFALRRALESARVDASITKDYFPIDLPLTGERIWSYCGNSVNKYTL